MPLDLRSPLITGLSLSLLLRADAAWVHALAGVIAIGSKFIFRLDGKHIWNPAGFAIVVLLFAMPSHIWISPGAWGSGVWFASLLVFFAILVLGAARRSDIAVFFIGAHAALLFARAAWLGDPFAIPLASTAERLAADLHVLHDLRPAHVARLASRSLHLRGLGRGARALHGVLHADAPGALRRADRARAVRPPDRSRPAGGTLRLAPTHTTRSYAMTLAMRLKSTAAIAAILAQLAAQTNPAAAFCGFYVAKADSKLFNKSSKVVLTRDGNVTAITMASDYEGSPKEFAVVIPMPTFIKRQQIGVVEMKTVDHLDAYTAPRLVEYHDENPCAPVVVAARAGGPVPAPMALAYSGENKRYKGVTVEANYDVGEYDVSILSAQESDGLVNWLTDNGYRIPDGAQGVLGSYIKQNMRFFVAKVNLDRMTLIGAGYLRPLQVRYDTAKFMLPLRLGTVNANGPQDLIVYALTKNGRVEAANYRTVKLPSDIDVPLYVKNDFGTFYKAMFDRAVAKEDMRAVFVEYAWDMGWCDPCAAEPLTNKELVELGARWIDGDDDTPYRAFSGGSERLRDAAARALRRDVVPGGPRVHRDQGSHELPGPLCAASPVEGHGDLPGRRHLSGLAAQPLPPGGAQPRRGHRLGAEGHRGAHGADGTIDEGREVGAPRSRTP